MTQLKDKRGVVMLGKQEIRLARKKKKHGEEGSITFNTAMLTDGIKLKLPWITNMSNNSGKVKILKYCFIFFHNLIYFLSCCFDLFLKRQLYLTQDPSVQS